MISEAIGSETDRAQRNKKEAARDRWRQGHYTDALRMIRTLLTEEMSPRVAAECFSVEAAILADMGDYRGSLDSLGRMAPFLDAADVRIQGTFYNGRARANKNLGDIPAALIDYSGAVALWQSCGDRNYEGAASINLAELYLTLGDLPQAGHNIDHALRVLPTNSEYLCDAFETKAKILLADHQVVKALRFIEQALKAVGSHEEKKKQFSETQSKIKQHLLDSIIPLINFPDLDDLRVQVIRHALDRAGGSITLAAKALDTSHQVVAYAARTHHLERARPKRSIIKKPN